MNPKGVTAGPPRIQGRCPHCMEKLGMKEILKRRLQKTCKCGKCGRKINERNIIW